MKNINKPTYMELIRATIEDMQVLLEMEKTTMGLKTYSGYYSEDEIKDWINNEIVFVIKDQDLAVGSISYETKSIEHAYISGLVIKPEFRKRGLARKAMSLLFEELKKFKKLSLVVHPENQAVSLYESFGFIKESREENYFGDGEPRLIMVKNI